MGDNATGYALQEQYRNMSKVAVIVGTRPEIIKLAPVIRALRETVGKDNVTTYSTGQHRDLFDQTLESLKIKVDVDFNLMTNSQSTTDIQQKIITALQKEFTNSPPDLVVVQGDTISAFAGAFTGFLCSIAVAHVEAGLRTGDLQNPWPEEGLRQMIARLSTLHFAPTPRARKNLLLEGISDGTIHVVGNPGIDTLEAARGEIFQRSSTVHREYGSFKKLALVTMHRREALNGYLDEFCEELRKAALEHPECCFVWPQHPNPTVKATIAKHFGTNGQKVPNIKLVEPFPYDEMIATFSIIDLVISDSGGLQEEVPYCGIPIIVIREVTERPEIIELGLGKLIGSKAQNLSEHVRHYLSAQVNVDAVNRWQAIQGKGQSAERIALAIANFLEGSA
jgi:UDP-N-acetylglucosamine 2-epimerase (non-hydrolysing)